MDNLKGKVALVSGGLRGIGKAICLKLAKEKASIAIVDLATEAEAEATVDEIKALGVEAVYLPADVSVAGQVKEAVDKAVAKFVKIDILINNAGITRDSLLIRMKEEDWDKVLEVNLKGMFNLTQNVARVMMKERQGSIVNISSVVGLSGNVGQVNYSASKAGVVGLTKSTARELGVRGIRANAIAPGFIETEMTEKLPAELKEEIIKRVPLGRFGTPEEVASLVAFLASDDSAYITGQVFVIDGGMIA